jgi:hypothetical protein
MAVQSCSAVTVNAIDARCEGSIGGIKEIYLLAATDMTGDLTIDEKTGVISKLGTLATDKKFQKWLFRPNTSSYTSTRSGDLTTGNSTVTTDVALQFSKAEAEKRLAIQSMINGGCIIIIKDMYGQYILLGYGEGRNECYITDAVMQSGTSNTDLSGFTLTFEEIAMEFPHFVDSSLIADIVA